MWMYMKLNLKLTISLVILSLFSYQCEQRADSDLLNFDNGIELDEDDLLITKNKFQIIHIDRNYLFAKTNNESLVSYDLRTGLPVEILAIDDFNYDSLFSLSDELFSGKSFVKAETDVVDIPELMISRTCVHDNKIYFLLLVLTQENTEFEGEVVKAFAYNPLLAIVDLNFSNIEYQGIEFTSDARSPLIEEFHIQSDSLWVVPNLIVDYKPAGTQPIFYYYLPNSSGEIAFARSSEYQYNFKDYQKGLRGALRSYLFTGNYYSDGRFLYNIFQNQKIDMIGSTAKLITALDSRSDTIYTREFDTQKKTSSLNSYVIKNPSNPELVRTKVLSENMKQGELFGNCHYYLNLNDAQKYELKRICI